MAVTEPDFSMKAHDRLPAIRAQLMTASDPPVPVDLTGATSVDFVMTPTVGGTPVVNTAAVFEDRINGIVRYDWIDADTATPGSFLGEWEVTWSNLKKQTFPTKSYHTISILADLDGS